MNDYELLYYIFQMDEEALAMLINKYMKNIHFLVNMVMVSTRYVCGSNDEYDEMVHLGVIELNQSIYNFRDNGRNTFRVFAEKCIEMRIRKHIRHKRGLSNYQFSNAISLDQRIKDVDGLYMIDSIRSTNLELEGDCILKWYHPENFKEYLKANLKKNELEIAQMKLDGYTHKEISQILMLQPKRVYYVCDKIKKLLLSYID